MTIKKPIETDAALLLRIAGHTVIRINNRHATRKLECRVPTTPPLVEETMYPPSTCQTGSLVPETLAVNVARTPRQRAAVSKST